MNIAFLQFSNTSSEKYILDLPEIIVFHEGKAEGLKEGEANGLRKGEAERKKLADKNTKLEDENASLKAELEKLKKQMK